MSSARNLDPANLDTKTYLGYIDERLRLVSKSSPNASTTLQPRPDRVRLAVLNTAIRTYENRVIQNQAQHEDVEKEQ